jgi:putative SOS response-associated peptidase YedK
VCNEYLRRIAPDALTERFSEIGIPIRWTKGSSNRPLDEPVKPTQLATILHPIDPANPAAGLEGVDLRWWMVPHFHKAAITDWRTMSTNAPLETVDTSPIFRDAYKARRCLAPLTSFIEYSEPPGWKKGQPKQRNEIEWEGGDVRVFAGLWERSTPSDRPEGLESFAFITGPAPPDIAPFQDRAPPVLTLEQGMEWLRLDGPGKAAFFDLPPAGAYAVKLSPREQIMSAAMRRALP